MNSEIEKTDAFQRDAIEKAEAKRASSNSRAAVYDKRKRLPYLVKKGLTKPGRISFEVLRRAVASLHVARICVNVLKEKVTKTKWAIRPIDPLQKVDSARIKELEQFFRFPNKNESFRTLLDKSLEDLLVLDAVAWEKTRYNSGKLSGLHYVDAATIRPVFDERGNNDVIVSLTNKNRETHEVPVSYVQILNDTVYGGQESGDIVSAWPRKDFVYFMMHPQGSMDAFGYGLSPVEAVIGVVANLLSADNFNASYFEDGSFPPILMHLQQQVSKEELETIREYLYTELDGRFHRPAIVAGEGKIDTINLKDLTQRDMQYMEYMQFMSRLLAAAYGLSGQDIGLTDDLNRATAEVQKDLSEAKGYGSILSLLEEVFNSEIIAKDFGYDDIKFEWVATDITNPQDSYSFYESGLRSGYVTLNEVRKKIGEQPYGEWADMPMILGTDGYKKIGSEEKTEESNPDDAVAGDSPFREQSVHKSVFTTDARYQCWADDRGVSQPFIFADILKGNGFVIKPPVAVNIDSQKLEEEWTKKLYDEGLNVNPVVRMTEPAILDKILVTRDLKQAFSDYQAMTSEFDSAKWRAKYGGSRRFPYYLVSKYVAGRALTDSALIADMKRAPEEYTTAIEELAELWLAEKKYVLGDRRADQVMITPDKHIVAFDFQFVGDEKRWKSTSDAYYKALALVPTLQELFEKKTGHTFKKSFIKKLFSS